MMKAGRIILRLCGVLLLLACVSAVTFIAVRAFAVPVPEDSGGGYTAWIGSDSGGAPEPGKWKYTQEDLAMVQGLKTGEYQEMSVEAFAKALADWTDEDVYHSREDALARLRRTYEEDGEYAAFIRRTLIASMGEAGTRHYGGYCTRHRDSFCDSTAVERQADVFGDAYTVFSACAEYELCYTILDGEKLTVGERDRILDAYRDAVQAFLKGFTEKQLLMEKVIEEKLEQELKRLDSRLSTDLMKLEGSSLTWYSAYGPEQ